MVRLGNNMPSVPPKAMDGRPKLLLLKIENLPTPPDQGFENQVKDCNRRIDGNCSFFGQSWERYAISKTHPPLPSFSTSCLLEHLGHYLLVELASMVCTPSVVFLFLAKVGQDSQQLWSQDCNPDGHLLFYLLYDWSRISEQKLSQATRKPPIADNMVNSKEMYITKKTNHYTTRYLL